MINNIDEAIAHCHEKAEEQKKKVITDEYSCNQGYKDNHNAKCLECAKEHEQLAEMLTELKQRREQDTEENETYKRGYQKGLKAGIRIGQRSERTMIIAYLEGKTKEEEEIENMIKNGEVEAIPYLGETAEEEPNT